MVYQYIPAVIDGERIIIGRCIFDQGLVSQTAPDKAHDYILCLLDNDRVVRNAYSLSRSRLTEDGQITCTKPGQCDRCFEMNRTRYIKHDDTRARLHHGMPERARGQLIRIIIRQTGDMINSGTLGSADSLFASTCLPIRTSGDQLRIGLRLRRSRAP